MRALLGFSFELLLVVATWIWACSVETDAFRAALMPPLTKACDFSSRITQATQTSFTSCGHHGTQMEQHFQFSLSTTARFMTTENEDESMSPQDEGRIDLSLDSRLYRIRLPRAPGIEWGTDLSFSFVYVRDLDPSGAASLSGMVNKGDQLCELVPVVEDGGAEAVNLMGAPFDFVMSAFAGLDKTITDVDLVFFKGTKDELKAAAADGGSGSGEKETITVTVIENKGSDKEAIRTLTAPAGVNVRELLVDNGINVYQSVTRWTNCKGKQLCGTCIVNITDGSISTNRKSMDEASTLRENPDSYRLSCVTFAYGDITVETFPPIKAAQWTR